MPARSSFESTTKAAISVSEMAKLIGLSRNHFFGLCKTGVFPMPVYSVRNRRPFFTADLQELCHTIRRTNISLSGDYIIFYRPRSVASSCGGKARRSPRFPKQERLSRLVAGMQQLGLSVTADQVEIAVREVYPDGLPVSDGDAIRGLFTHFRRSLSR